MTLSATVAEAKDLTQPDKARLRPPKLRIGLEVETLTEKEAAKRHFTTMQGVLITAIDPNSEAAAKEELNPGVLILQVNDTDTPTEKAYLNAIKALKSGSLVRLLCQLDSGRKIILLPVD